MSTGSPSKGALRWGTFLAALMVVGPAIGWIAHTIPPVAGSAEGTALLSSSFPRGVGGMLQCLFLAMLIGIAGSRLVSVGQGLTCMGAALCWACFHTGHLPDLVRATPWPAIGTKLALEGALLGGFTLIGSFAIMRRGWAPDEPWSVKSMFSPVALGAGFAAAAGGMAAAWLIAQDDRPGQTFAAAVAAGAVGAVIARTFVNGAPRSAVLWAIPIGAIACPVAGLVLAGGSHQQVEMAILGGTESPWARIMPIDWCAGLLIGIPFGVSWAGSMIEKAHHETAGKRPAAPGPVTSAS